MGHRLAWVIAPALLSCAESVPAPEPMTPARCVDARDCGYVMVSAHRGHCGDGEPENTLAAFLACERLGVTITEVDTRVTADGVVVINHDDDVARTTDGETRFPDRQKVDQLTLAEITQLVVDDPRCREQPDSQPERCRLTTFDAILAATEKTVFFVDYKSGDLGPLIRGITSRSAANRVLFFDSNLTALRTVKQALPEIEVMPRARSAADVRALLGPENADLDLKWIHGDPGYASEVEAELTARGVRFYANAFHLDPFIKLASGLEPADRDALLDGDIWPQLRKMIADGVDCFGTEAPVQILAELYPAGWGR